MAPDLRLVLGLRVGVPQRLHALRRDDKRRGQRRVGRHQRGRRPPHTERVEDEGREVRRRQQDARHAVAAEAGGDEVALARRGRADEGERVGRRRHEPRPDAALARRQRQLPLFLVIVGPADDLLGRPRRDVLGDAGQVLAVVAALEPGAGVVRDDGLGAAEGDGVVGGGELQVVVPDLAVPVLGARVADEARGRLEGGDGADAGEDEVGVLGEEVRGPGVLSGGGGVSSVECWFQMSIEK